MACAARAQPRTETQQVRPIKGERPASDAAVGLFVDFFRAELAAAPAGGIIAAAVADTDPNPRERQRNKEIAQRNQQAQHHGRTLRPVFCARPRLSASRQTIDSRQAGLALDVMRG